MTKVSRVVTVHALGIAATLRPKEVVAVVAAPGDPVKLTKTHALVRRGDACIVIYDFGAVVFFDVDQHDRERVLARILEKVGPEPHPPLLDDYLVEVREGANPEVTFDRAVVPDLETPVVELLSLVLAQSVAMDYYDEDIVELFRRVDRMAATLAVKGSLSGRARELNRFVGNILVTRNQILTTVSLLDAPSITWEREVYDRLYRALRTTFEIEDRYRTVEHKLRIIQDNLDIIVDLVQHRRAAFLEVTVVVLIAFELALAIYEHFLRR
ncbi:MAG: hypothetical protein NVS3B20_05190 [Polyangiales bacterium]